MLVSTLFVWVIAAVLAQTRFATSSISVVRSEETELWTWTELAKLISVVRSDVAEHRASTELVKALDTVRSAILELTQSMLAVISISVVRSAVTTEHRQVE